MITDTNLPEEELQRALEIDLVERLKIWENKNHTMALDVAIENTVREWKQAYLALYGLKVYPELTWKNHALAVRVWCLVKNQ